MDPMEKILSSLRGRGHEARSSGDGWTCRCPAHDDRRPSLSLRAGDDGRALVTCHAGCSASAVCAALGLGLRDLMPDDPNRGAMRRAPVHSPANGGGRTYTTAREAVEALQSRLGPRSAMWTYTSATGEPVGLVLRWNTPEGKTVRPVSRIAPGPGGAGWRIGGMPEPRPLYRLHELPTSTRVWVCEGEKAADAARALGLAATTSPHGSKSAAKADWTPLAARDVVILPDRDEAGEHYANDVSHLVINAGAASARIVRLHELWEDLPRGGDIADLIEHRGGGIRAEIEALADRTGAVVETRRKRTPGRREDT